MPYYVSDADNTSLTGFRYPSQYLAGGIVTSGLVMNFDAASYSGSGSTWTDTINGTSTTLNNTSYSGGSSPYFYFNGTSAYAVNNGGVTNPLTGTNNATIMLWIYPDLVQPDATYSGMFALGTKAGGGVSLLFSMKSNRQMTMAKWGDDSTDGTLAPPDNRWSLVSLTKNGAITRFGVNGQTFQNSSNTGTNNFSGSILTIGCTDTPGRYFKGNIASILLYRTALNDGQILQNFEATRNRYGV